MDGKRTYTPFKVKLYHSLIHGVAKKSHIIHTHTCTHTAVCTYIYLYTHTYVYPYTVTYKHTQTPNTDMWVRTQRHNW